MQGNALKLIGSSLIVIGLVGGGFVAGGMSSGKSNADPAPTPTPTFEVQEDPIATPEPGAPEDQGTYRAAAGTGRDSGRLCSADAAPAGHATAARLAGPHRPDTGSSG